MDDALFLLRPDDDNAGKIRSQQVMAETDLADLYLEGTLPGG